MTTYVEAYETVRNHLMPDGWALAGQGERYPGDYRGRALTAVRALWNYLDRTAEFWALEPEPDGGLDGVLGRYNSLWDALYRQPSGPEPAPEGTLVAAAGPGDATVADATDTAVLEKCEACGHLAHPGAPCPECFAEPDEPVTQVLEAIEAEDQDEMPSAAGPLDPAEQGPLAGPEVDE